MNQEAAQEVQDYLNYPRSASKILTYCVLRARTDIHISAKSLYQALSIEVETIEVSQVLKSFKISRTMQGAL